MGTRGKATHQRKRIEPEHSEHAGLSTLSSNDADTARECAQRWPLEPEHGTELAIAITQTQKLGTMRSALKLTDFQRQQMQHRPKWASHSFLQIIIVQPLTQNPGSYDAASSSSSK